MGNFEILGQNIINTTTMISITSNDSDSNLLFDRDPTTQWISSGDNDDNTVTILYIRFGVTTTFDRMIIQNTNVEAIQVRFWTNGGYTTVAINNAATSISYWGANTESNLYLKFNTISTLYASIIMYRTQIDNEEKKIGELWICYKTFEFEYNPAVRDYKPKLSRKKASNEMSDGGNAVYVFGDSYQADINLNFVSASETSNFKDIFDNKQSFVVVPYPTGTSWEGDNIYEVNWNSDYSFLQPAGNNWNQVGYNGKIRIKETPK